MSSNDIAQPEPGGLSELFGGAGLSGPKRKRPVRPAGPQQDRPVTADTGPVPTRPVAEQADTAQEAPAPVPARKSGRGSSKVPEGTVRRAAMVPVALHERAKLHNASSGRTLTQLILIAVAATSGRLKELLAEDAAARREEDVSPEVAEMFPDLVLSRAPEVTKPMPFYPTPAQLQRLDELSEQLGAADRSRLITVALRDYLSAASPVS